MAKLQRESGVKDKIAQHWIEIVLKKAKEEQHRRITNKNTRDPRLLALRGEERKALVERIKEDIRGEMHLWLVTQPEHRFNALPLDSGTFHPWAIPFSNLRLTVVLSRPTAP